MREGKVLDFQGFMKRQEDDPQDAKDVFRDKLLTSSQIEEHKVLAQHSIKR